MSVRNDAGKAELTVDLLIESGDWEQQFSTSKTAVIEFKDNPGDLIKIASEFKGYINSLELIVHGGTQEFSQPSMGILYIISNNCRVQ